jgi:uncharacterized protein YndB with AHSA1/START domain
MEHYQVPTVKVEMLIRRPVAEVFQAFIDPAITTKFWFTRSSGRLVAGKKVQWDWEMYGHSAQVDVRAIEENNRIIIWWPGQNGPTTVEWIFTPRAGNTTFVTITNSGFRGTGDEIVKQALDSTEGFTLVLAGLKALLEHNVALNLVPDRFPDTIVNH